MSSGFIHPGNASANGMCCPEAIEQFTASFDAPPTLDEEWLVTEFDVAVAAVLEAVADTASSEFRDRPVVLKCPGCQTSVEERPDGLRSKEPMFAAECASCGAELYPWNTVVIDAAYHDHVSSTDLKRLVQHYWQIRLQEGATQNGCPRTWEYSEKFVQAATAFGWDDDLSVGCLLCRRTLKEIRDAYYPERTSDNRPKYVLHFHHWERGPQETGTSLCFGCHEFINWRQTDNQIDEVACDVGITDLHDVQLARLAIAEQLQAGCTTSWALAHKLIDRYNLPMAETEVESIINKTRQVNQLSKDQKRTLTCGFVTTLMSHFEHAPLAEYGSSMYTE